MAYDNLKQIAKYTTKTTVLDFVDNLKINNFDNKLGQRKSTVHEIYSRIKLTIVDWSKGKKENAVVVQYNLEPEQLKALSYLIINNKNEFFNSQDNNQKRHSYSKYKVNHYNRNTETGMAPVSRLDVTYETGLKAGPKWKITIENGEAPPLVGEEGQVTYNSNKYVSLKKASIYISPLDAVVLMMQVYSYINNFELVNFNSMLKNRNTLIENEITEKQASQIFSTNK